MTTEPTNQEKLINEEYKVWKKNSPFLYDLILSSALEWPSLTVQWLPDKKTEKDGSIEYSVQRMILGTHTNQQETNHLMICEVKLPTPDTETLKEKYDDSCDVYGGLGGAAGKFEIKQRIIHEGEVNRARYMPQNQEIIATKLPSGKIHVFDRTKHLSKPAKGGKPNPQVICEGHKKEGYAIAWSPFEEGLLLSGAEDKLILGWDIRKHGTKSNSSCQHHVSYRGHKSAVEDLSWHRRHANIFASVSDDKSLRIWDYKLKNDSPTHVVNEAHKGEVNCVSFSPFNEHLLITGGADKVIGLWDMRNLSKKLHTLESHSDAVYQCDWCPHSEVHLATGGADRRVMIWDLSLIGNEQSAEDAEDGPPELLFVHGGHTDKISDFNWNQSDPWVIASVADNNIIQVWQMTDELLADTEGGDDNEQDDDAQLE